MLLYIEHPMLMLGQLFHAGYFVIWAFHVTFILCLYPLLRKNVCSARLHLLSKWTRDVYYQDKTQQAPEREKLVLSTLSPA